MVASLWTLGFLAVIALLVIVIWSIRRHRDPKLEVQCDAPIDDLVTSLAGITLSTPVDGNSVELIENGRFYDVILERIAAARQHVHFETFLWKDGQLGRKLAAAFIHRARAGVHVRIMLDDTGSRNMGKDVLKQLRDAGCKVRFFHKRSLRNLGVLNNRDHRKLIVIDGREAFVGGHCIVDEWLGDAEDGCHFSDLSVWLHGPIVNNLQGVFSENWTGDSGELLVGEGFFPKLERAGDVTMHPVFVKPENSAPTIKILHHTVICLARKRIWIQNPYFIPEPEAIKAFGAAVKRGVDVRVLMPSTSGSDNPMVQHAGHRNFEMLMEHGVKLFEYPHTLLHQKVMTVDGIWSAIGSTNFDDRSFETNDEITLAILDKDLAGQLDGVFEKYVKRAEEIDLDRWRHRSWRHKAIDNMFYLFKSFF
ncbi:phospholipase D-like domain-containing protein [Ramlibacter sp. PS4R-6]|uniref:phospholipase D-like domain-containing protein n=1 Tax=Ramlibacter sp. PS4R-6 TaxID=3133438 RepID=UPI003097EBB2